MLVGASSSSSGVDPNADMRGVWFDPFGFGFSGLLSPNTSAKDQCLCNCTDDPANGTPAISSFTYWGHWANAARSRHPGGVNVCMADGSVHFVQNAIDLAVWQALISANGSATAAANAFEIAPTAD